VVGQAGARLRDGRRADDDEVVPRARQRDVQPLRVGGKRAGARHRQRQHDRRLLHALRGTRIPKPTLIQKTYDANPGD